MSPERKENLRKNGVIFAVIENNRIILQQRLNPMKSYFGFTIIPGGKVEENEEVEAALFREMQEETGLTPVKWKYLSSVEVPTEKGNLYLHSIYLITKTKGVFDENKEKDGLMIRVSLENAVDLCKHPFSQQILQLIEKEL